MALVERDHIETLVLRRPMLMQELGRAIEERKAGVRRARGGVDGNYGD